MNKFAFIIHPLEARDIGRKFKLTRHLPEWLLEKMMLLLPPMVASQITGVASKHEKIEGWFVGCPLTARQMLTLPEEQVIKRIIKAGRLAEDLGAGIVGLGAMTSVVGDAGVTIARELDIAVTTGNTYTVATAMEGTKYAAELMDISLGEARVAVVGATGSIGAVCARLLAREAGDIVLLARNRDRLSKLAGLIREESEVRPWISTDIKAELGDADIVVSVSSAAEAIISPGDLKPGSVVCDVARPRDVSRDVQEQRDDVLVIEGGVVAVPGEDMTFNFNFGFPERTAYACMAETMILALEGRFENYSLGRELSMERVDEISRLAKKHGFNLAGLRSFERAVKPETIERIRDRAAKKRRRTVRLSSA